ncbi:hypothetical protein [Neisseria benedictiae]|uniref:hypothetical protein n=1 Tax=Neisseria benedictiae TaxID=2830649 RepID=UPI00265A3D7B|nr:hypothetical protein [Neisseria benedictiae]
MPSETIKQCFRRHQHLRGFAIFTKTASQNPVIPQKQKNQKQKSRHSRAGGNPKTQSCKNLLEMAETQRTRIPTFVGMTGEGLLFSR